MSAGHFRPPRPPQDGRLTRGLHIRHPCSGPHANSIVRVVGYDKLFKENGITIVIPEIDIFMVISHFINMAISGRYNVLRRLFEFGIHNTKYIKFSEYYSTMVPYLYYALI